MDDTMKNMKRFRFHLRQTYRYITQSDSFFSTLFILIASISIASWLMFSTFSYTQSTHALLLSSKVWSDFGAHIPMIRSFSMGDNLLRLGRGFMPEYPLFPGEPMRYHFLFYMGVGILERLGIRIDWALNSLSIIGFAGMTIAIYFVAKRLTSDARIGFLAWIFTLFNGSFTFIEYFRAHPLSTRTFLELPHLNEFVSFAPWKSGDISAFWSLNIYTNQRHLAFAFAIFFFFLLTLINLENQSANRRTTIKNLSLLPWGIALGFLPFFHQPTFITIAIACTWYLLVFPKLRIPLIWMGCLTSVIAIPQLLLLSKGQSTLMVAIGYLMDKPYTIMSIFLYWWHNIGFHLLLIPIGFLLSPKRVKLYLFPAFLFFAMGFCFQFSRELAANHKFFNLFLIMGSIFSAAAIVKLIDLIDGIQTVFLRIPALLLPCILIITLTASGVIDLLPIVNDRTISLQDIQSDQTAQWFAKNTEPDAIILNSSLFFHPASLAGRKIFLGWPYFAWSAGYDTDKRNQQRTLMYENKNPSDLCRLLSEYHISFATFESNLSEDITFNEEIYRTAFPLVFESPNNSFRVYQVNQVCSKIKE
jgi:hypothetical protein